MESTRQQKIGKQILKDLSDILQKEAAPLVRGILVSVTLVRMSPDYSLAKVYISVFPFEKSEAVKEILTENVSMIRGALGSRVKNQLRHVPEIAFYIDDSLEYISGIDRLLKQ